MAISDTAWSRFSEADYSPAEWRRACLVDRGPSAGNEDAKGRYSLPVREPSGALNRNAVHAAAGGHGVGALRGVSAEMKRAAARELVGLYRDQLNEDPPESLLALAGMRSAEEMATVTEPQYRSFTPDLQVRSQGDGRTIYGIAVPYNAPTRIDGSLVEQFSRGAFNHQLGKPSRVRFAREHVKLGGSLIGAATMLRDDAAGLYGEFRVSKTPIGDETLELVRDGALDHLSIGFGERQNRRLVGGITERVKADLFEVAVVMEGAYGDLAVAAGVRSAAPMSSPLSSGDHELRARAEEFLLPGGLPEPTEHDLEIRALRLGIPF